MDLSYNTLDPQEILLNFTLGDSTQSIPFGALDSYQNESIQRGIVHACSIGAYGVLIIVLFIYNSNRRKTPVFFINIATLITASIWSVLYLVYLMGPLAAPSFGFTGIAGPSSYKAYQIITATNSFHVILVALIEMSMVFQIYVIFRSPEVRKLGNILTVGAAILGTAAVSFFIVNTVRNAQLYHSLIKNDSANERDIPYWINNVNIILFSASVNIFSILLMTKLWFAIRTRRFLGLKQFSSFHVLFIMSTQTMIIPSILVLVSYKYTSLKYPTLVWSSTLIIVLSLPLSSMWAQVANNDPNTANYSFLNRATSNSTYGSGRSTGDENKTLTDSSFLPKKYYNSPKDRSQFEENTYSQPGTADSLDSQLPPEISQIIDSDYNDFAVNYLSQNSPNSISKLAHSDQGSSDDSILNNVRDNFISVTTHNVELP